MSYRWIRVQSEVAQFDHRADRPLRVGVTVVKGYPEHVGTYARPGKRRVSKGSKATAKKAAPRKRAAKKSAAKPTTELPTTHEVGDNRASIHTTDSSGDRREE